MRINFITIATENLASYRYHIKTPAIELHKLGHKVFISKSPITGCDAYIFHKHLRKEEPEILIQVKKENPNSKTVFICCDYHLDNQHEVHYRRMIQLCDELVVCTSTMGQILFAECGKKSTLIDDPWEINIHDASAEFKKKDKYDLLWFGSATNLNSLIASIPDIHRHNLTIVTSHETGNYLINEKKVKIINYTLPELSMQLKLCDLVIIPQEVNTKSKIVKSPNRLVDSLRAGRFTIASPIPAYLELKSFAYIGDLKSGFDWIDTVSEVEIEKKINEGKKYIEDRFNPNIIGKKWENLLSK